MKKFIYISLIILSICSFIYYAYARQQNSKLKIGESFRVIVNFDSTIVSNELLSTKIQDIRWREVKEILSCFSVSELKAVYRNRYDKNGQLKHHIIDKTKESWQQVVMQDENKALELVDLLKKVKGIKTAYIEVP